MTWSNVRTPTGMPPLSDTPLNSIRPVLRAPRYRAGESVGERPLGILAEAEAMNRVVHLVGGLDLPSFESEDLTVRLYGKKGLMHDCGSPRRAADRT